MACAYGLLSYLTAFLKTHYPLYFMTACLSSKSNKAERLSVFINECKRMGIKVSPPNVNLSNSQFTALSDKNEILFGLRAIKGLGKSMVDQIIASRPYSNFNEFKSKIPDRSIIITLIKAGAFPTNNKMKLLKKYADSLFERKQYCPVQQYKTKKEMYEVWGIDVDSFKVGRFIDKEAVLSIYNQKKEAEFLRQQNEKYHKHMEAFKKQYAQNEYLWEFETLSMFLTHDPLKEAYKYVADWDLVEENTETVVLCVIVDIKRKKDKNGNQFAYLDLYTPYGIIEATCWAGQLREYNDLVKKTNCVAIKGRKKEGNHLFVSKMKPYTQWLADRKLR